MGQGGVAGTEIVDGDSNTDGLHGLEAADRGLGVKHEDVLGEPEESTVIAAVAKRVGREFGVASVERLPLPRLTRAEREELTDWTDHGWR